jgi:exodeoxyribonuclease VII large subunit
MPEPSVYRVSELTLRIKRMLQEGLPEVWVEGEISNFLRHSSGHCYFTLKDAGSQLRCVLFRSQNSGLFFTPLDGMNVLAFGKITVYERAGQYQLNVLQLKPRGQGELSLAFEQLRERLRAEGLFAAEHKRSLPVFPRTVGLVTSPTGAALRDMLKILRRRWPALRVIIRATQVQGDGAARDIASAIADFNELRGVDLLIVGRGGGSLEDLWAFNEEVVARAIYNSEIPIISAVGHEVDTTIADFVADVRAPTPSAAAETAVPEWRTVQDSIRSLGLRSWHGISAALSLRRERLSALLRAYALSHPRDRLRQNQQRRDELSRRILQAVEHRVELVRERYEAVRRHLTTLDPRAVLKRGYSICRRVPDGALVRDAGMLVRGSSVEVMFYRGLAECAVTATRTQGTEHPPGRRMIPSEREDEAP